MSNEKEPVQSIESLIDDVIQKRFDMANDKADEITKLIEKNIKDGYDELSIFLEIARSVEAASLVDPALLNGICAEFASLAIKLAKAQMEK